MCVTHFARTVNDRHSKQPFQIVLKQARPYTREPKDDRKPSLSTLIQAWFQILWSSRKHVNEIVLLCRLCGDLDGCQGLEWVTLSRQVGCSRLAQLHSKRFVIRAFEFEGRFECSMAEILACIWDNDEMRWFKGRCSLELTAVPFLVRIRFGLNPWRQKILHLGNISGFTHSYIQKY